MPMVPESCGSRMPPDITKCHTGKISPAEKQCFRELAILESSASVCSFSDSFSYRGSTSLGTGTKKTWVMSSLPHPGKHGCPGTKAIWCSQLCPGLVFWLATSPLFPWRQSHSNSRPLVPGSGKAVGIPVFVF